MKRRMQRANKLNAAPRSSSATMSSPRASPGEGLDSGEQREIALGKLVEALKG